MNKTLKITDLDFSFREHPLSGNLVLKSGPDVIKQSLKTLVLMNMFEKPFSILGGNITNKLFEDFNYSLVNQLSNNLLFLINTYEPRIEVLASDILIEQDDLNPNSLNIIISYIIIGEDVPKQELNLEVTRSR
jgi:hypothetical protein